MDRQDIDGDLSKRRCRPGLGGGIGLVFDVEDIPSGPDPNLPPIDELERPLQRLISQLRDMLKERPIITRRLLLNKLGRAALHNLRFAMPYCTYSFLSGPWRDAMVRFGVDPRKDPEMRKYQTLSIKLTSKVNYEQSTRTSGQQKTETVKMGTHPDSHMFDGKKFIRDGSVWQLCDITDPQLMEFIARSPQPSCDVRCRTQIEVLRSLYYLTNTV